MEHHLTVSNTVVYSILIRGNKLFLLFNSDKQNMALTLSKLTENVLYYKNRAKNKTTICGEKGETKKSLLIILAKPLLLRNYISTQ